MRRNQAMFHKVTQSQQQQQQALPPNWDPNKNLFIENKRLTRYDHLMLPFWSDFVEYCENIPSNYTLQDYLNLLDSKNCSGIGVTRLKLDPLIDEQNVTTWSYNEDFDTNDPLKRWTNGNEDFNIYSFYHIAHVQDDWSSTEQAKQRGLHYVKIRSEIESRALYDSNPVVDNVKISNRNMSTYYGTTRNKVTSQSYDLLPLFKIGETKTLENIQQSTGSEYSQSGTYKCYNFFRNTASNLCPFHNYNMIEIYYYYDPSYNAQINRRLMKAAPLAIMPEVVIYSQTIDGVLHRIYANAMIIATTKTTQEVDIFTL